MQAKNVFITGSTGIVGARLIYELYKQNHKLNALLRNKKSLNKLTNTLKLYTNEAQQIVDSINWVIGDVCDIDLLSQEISADMDVYHCAAMVSFNPKNNNKLKEVNVQGTANMVNVCIDKGVRKFCHVSSIGALGTPLNGVTTTESPWLEGGKSPYSVSKHDSEMEVWRGIAEGLNAVIINPAVIIGAGEWETSSAALFGKVAKGMKYYTLGSTSYVYVNDVVSVMLKLMDSDISEKRFILSAETLTYKDVFEKIAVAIEASIPRKHAGKFLTALAWRLAALKNKIVGGEPLISKYTHITAHSLSSFDGSPITEAIDFNYTSIDDAINDTAKRYKQNMQ